MRVWIKTLTDIIDVGQSVEWVSLGNADETVGPCSAGCRWGIWDQVDYCGKATSDDVKTNVDAVLCRREKFRSPYRYREMRSRSDRAVVDGNAKDMYTVDKAGNYERFD